MRILKLSIFIVGIGLFSCINQSSNVEIEFQGEILKGKVKYLSLTEYDAKMVDGKVVKSNPDNGEKVFMVHYGKKGDLKAQYLYGFKDEIINKKAYKYDNKGNCIEEKLYNGLDVLFARKYSIYNNNNQIVEEISISGNLSDLLEDTDNLKKHLKEMENNISGENIYSYDDNGALISMVRISQSEQVMRISYQNNEIGDPIALNFFDKNDSITQSVIYKYNKESNPISVIYKNSYDSIERIVNTTYDTFGDKKVVVAYNSDNSISYTIKYNTSGKIIEIERFNKKAEIFSQENYLYNEVGDMINYYTKNSSMEKAEIKKITYEYDENRNWIKRTTLNEMDEPTSITERKIMYYRLIDKEIEPF